MSEYSSANYRDLFKNLFSLLGQARCSEVSNYRTPQTFTIDILRKQKLHILNYYGLIILQRGVKHK